VNRPEELDARGRRLRAALAAVLVRDNAPELRLVRAWLDSWSGLGLINLRHNAPGVGRITTPLPPTPSTRAGRSNRPERARALDREALLAPARRPCECRSSIVSAGRRSTHQPRRPGWSGGPEPGSPDAACEGKDGAAERSPEFSSPLSLVRYPADLPGGTNGPSRRS
jgi:hypothetical protein